MNGRCVGTGQVVNMGQNEEYNYRRQLEQAELAGNQEAVQVLRDIGPPPFSDRSALETHAYPCVVCSSRSIGKSIGFQRQQEFLARNTQYAIL